MFRVDGICSKFNSKCDFATDSVNSLQHNILHYFCLVLVFWNLLLGDSAFSLYFVTSSFLCRKGFGAGLNFSHRSLSSHLHSERELGSFYTYFLFTV